MKHAIKLLKHQIDLNQKSLQTEKLCKFSQELWEIMEARKVYIKNLKDALQVLKLEQERRSILKRASAPQGLKLDAYLIKRAFQTAGPRKQPKPNLPKAKS